MRVIPPARRPALGGAGRACAFPKSSAFGKTRVRGLILPLCGKIPRRGNGAHYSIRSFTALKD